MATRDTARLSSEAEAVCHVVASYLVLAQIIASMPKDVKARPALWFFMLFPVITYIMNVAAILDIPGSASIRDSHPVEALIQQAHINFQNLTQRQSSSYEMAFHEYQRRYRIEPPPGFEAWYRFAASRKSPIIDDFDLIMSTVSPFLAISGQEVNKMMSDAYSDGGSELWLCHFSSRHSTTKCKHHYRSYDRHISTLFNELLQGLEEKLPDVSFLVNHLDEPRVAIPLSEIGTRGSVGKSFNLKRMSHQPTWEDITRACNFNHSDELDIRDQAPQTFQLPFVHDSTTKSLCRHPEYKAMHGLFLSPTSMKLFEGLVPVLSTGAPSTMGDILFPSPAYMESEFQYTLAEENDVEWDKKRNRLYWAGSNTGGFAIDDKWRSYHRQRFVEFTRNLRQQRYRYLREHNGLVSCVESPFLNGRLYDVAFTRISQCQRQLCRDQRAYFGTKPWADRDQALKSRLVFDLDGNGISGRYYKLLASKSLPLKQTLLREWHDDRLVPWVHFVPVSQSMEELPELVHYLTSTESGRQRAREMARQGREWFFNAFRKDDLSIYAYRLLLELARLQDPSRKAME